MREITDEYGKVVKLQWMSALCDPKQRPEGLQAVDINIGLVLATFTDYNGEGAWPSLRTLAEASGRSKTTVTRSLRKLERVQAISRLPGSRTTSTRYYLEDFTLNWSPYEERPTAEELAREVFG